MFDWIKRLLGLINEVEYQEKMNQRTVDALESGGSNLSKPHSIEHHFNFSNTESLIKLAEKGKSLGYTPDNVLEPESDDGDGLYCLDLIKPTVPTLETMNRDSQLMMDLAEEFSADYDGWGCEVVD